MAKVDSRIYKKTKIRMREKISNLLRISKVMGRCIQFSKVTTNNLKNHIPNRMQPGSLRDSLALFSIIFMNSSMRSSLISASTMTENGLDDILRAVLE